MNGGTGFRENNQKTKFIKGCKGQKIVEIHDRLHLEGLQHTEKRRNLFLFIFFAVSCFKQNKFLVKSQSLLVDTMNRKFRAITGNVLKKEDE